MDGSEFRPGRRAVGWWAAAIVVGLCAAVRELRDVAASALYIAYLTIRRHATRRSDAVKTDLPRAERIR